MFYYPTTPPSLIGQAGGVVAATAALKPRLGARLVLMGNNRRHNSISSQSRPDSSYDSDELDYGLAWELEGTTQGDKYSKLASHLQLLYDASESGKVEPCCCCDGSGEQECNWCHGTGAMTIGDTLYCRNSGCTPCPVCHGTGACQCRHCRGTGKRASWLASTPDDPPLGPE